MSRVSHVHRSPPRTVRGGRAGERRMSLVPWVLVEVCSRGESVSESLGLCNTRLCPGRGVYQVKAQERAPRGTLPETVWATPQPAWGGRPWGRSRPCVASALPAGRLPMSPTQPPSCSRGPLRASPGPRVGQRAPGTPAQRPAHPGSLPRSAAAPSNTGPAFPCDSAGPPMAGWRALVSVTYGPDPQGPLTPAADAATGSSTKGCEASCPGPRG